MLMMEPFPDQPLQVPHHIFALLTSAPNKPASDRLPALKGQ